MVEKAASTSKRDSSSSDEPMDTSDEVDGLVRDREISAFDNQTLLNYGTVFPGTSAESDQRGEQQV